MMKTYKTIIVISAFMCVALGMLPVAQASLSNGDNLTFNSMDPVSFYLYDLDGNGAATLNASTLSVGGNPGYTLEYSTNGSDFSALSTSTPIEYDGSKSAQVYFRVDPGNGDPSLDKGDVTFQNYDADESGAKGLDLFHALFVNWDSDQFALSIASSDDRFSSSAVPIPPSALLLATGLIGMIGFQRQMKNR